MIQQFHSWLFIRRKQKHQFACTSVFIVALFTIAKTWKPPKCPSTDEWIQKMWYIYTMEYYSAMKKNEILPLATTWMDLEGIMFSETESDREGQTLCFLKNHLIHLEYSSELRQLSPGDKYHFRDSPLTDV